MFQFYILFGTKAAKPASVLSDIFEAVAGAILLDSDMKIEPVRDVYLNLMRPDIEKMIELKPRSPIRLLYEKYPDAIVK